jgi:hypothetical protein
MLSGDRARVEGLGGYVLHGDECQQGGLSGVRFERVSPLSAEMAVSCKFCHDARWLPDPQPRTAEAKLLTTPRYRLECVGCGRVIRRWTARPVVPLCSLCTAIAVTRRQRRAARRQREEEGR